MRNKIIRGALLGILLLGFTIPGVALAGQEERAVRILEPGSAWRSFRRLNRRTNRLHPGLIRF